MYLKEAFRYQNYLESLIERAVVELSIPAFTTKTKQEHMRSKFNPEASDETIENVNQRAESYTPNDLVRFLEEIVASKVELATAISKAKASSEIDIDAEVANNRVRQRVAAALGNMAEQKSTERMTRGVGYKFNADGNQVSYNYDIKEIVTIDFDRNKVRAFMRKLTGMSDAVSAAIDRALVTVEVDYTPKYDVNDSFDDAVEIFLK